MLLEHVITFNRRFCAGRPRQTPTSPILRTQVCAPKMLKHAAGAADISVRAHRRKRLCHQIAQLPVTSRTFEVASIGALTPDPERSWRFPRSFSKDDHRAQPPFPCPEAMSEIVRACFVGTCSDFAIWTRGS